MKKILIFLSVFVGLLFVAAPSTFAKVITSKGGDVHVNSDETVDDDLFIGAQRVVIDGVVNGNLFIGAKSARITGTVNGNIYVGAESVYLSGPVKGSVHIGGQDVTINGSHIAGSLLLASSDAVIDKSTVVEGSVLTADRSIDINSQVKRNVYALAKVFSLGSSAMIGRDLNYATSSTAGNVSISPTATVAGEVHKTEIQQQEPRQREKHSGLPFGFTLFSFISAAIVGMLYLKYFNSQAHKLTDLVVSSPGKTLLAGLIASLALIPALILVGITIVGIPLAFISLVIFMLWGYVAKFVVGLAIGEFLTKRFNWKLNQYMTLLVGLSLFYIVKMIPVVGGIVGLLVFIVGVGAFVLHTFSLSKHAK